MIFPEEINEDIIYYLLDRYVTGNQSSKTPEWSHEDIEAHTNWCVEEGYLEGVPVEKHYQGQRTVSKYLPSLLTALGAQYHAQLKQIAGSNEDDHAH